MTMHKKASSEVPHGIPRWSYIMFAHSGNEDAIRDRMMTCIDMAELASSMGYVLITCHGI